MKNHDFQPGAVRFESKNDSSPTSRPVTRVMPYAAHLRGERVQPQRGQCRVAVTLEDEVAAPERAFLLTLADHRRLELVGGPEGVQRRVGDGELLVGGGDQGQRQVVGVDGEAGREIDGEGSRPGRRDVRRPQGLCQFPGEGRRCLLGRRRLGRGEAGDDYYEDECQAPRHPAMSSYASDPRQEQVGPLAVKNGPCDP